MRQDDICVNHRTHLRNDPEYTGKCKHCGGDVITWKDIEKAMRCLDES